MQRDLPSGTVTFLFTDVEGSTKLLHELGPDAFSMALAEHRRILRAAFSGHGGVEVDTQGDAFFYAFPDARKAVVAAGEGQEGLAATDIRVRIGLHTGTPHVTDEGYIGPDVHLGARIGAAGHGGQVLLSKETRELIDIEVLDLGEHRLKDFADTVWIYQLGPERFPPLKTISNTNLPRPASSFVGREQELKELIVLVQNGDRVVTLTGPGGTGKTRLSIEAAGELVPEFLNGVFWVGLAPLRDPALVIPAITQTIGAKDGLAEHIAAKQMLLVLDNFEQVIDAATDLNPVVEACPNLRVLVTSRELLRIPGEVEYPVPPLETNEAVELFCRRSRLEADPTIAELCNRLDNLPLAVELAAARVKVLSPERILERLGQRLDILTGGRAADPRQATLRATIEWSHDLLHDDEKRLFARLAVFRGGCTLEAAEEVADADLDTLQSLVDKSLVRHTGDRFWMLETIRGFAQERLAKSEEEQEIRGRHLDYFLAVGERAYDGHLRDAPRWLLITEAEADNLRAALDRAESTDAGVTVRLAGALAPLWVLAGRELEAHERLIAALARSDAADPARARVLMHFSEVLFALNVEHERALEHLDEALAIWRADGDRRSEALTLDIIGYRYHAAGDNETARGFLEDSLALSRASDAPEIEGRALGDLCQVLVSAGDPEPAEREARRLYDLAIERGDTELECAALHYLADAPLLRGEFVEAETRYARALARHYEAGFAAFNVSQLLGVAMAAAGRGDHARAVRLAEAAYARREALGMSGESPVMFWRNLQTWFIGGARAFLSPTELEEATRAGRAADFDEIVAEVLNEVLGATNQRS
jgi:predicted ATPase